MGVSRDLALERRTSTLSFLFKRVLNYQRTRRLQVSFKLQPSKNSSFSPLFRPSLAAKNVSERRKETCDSETKSRLDIFFFLLLLLFTSLLHVNFPFVFILHFLLSRTSLNKPTHVQKSCEIGIQLKFPLTFKHPHQIKDTQAGTKTLVLLRERRSAKPLRLYDATLLRGRCFLSPNMSNILYDNWHIDC